MSSRRQLQTMAHTIRQSGTRQLWRTRVLATLNNRGFRLLQMLDIAVLYAELWLITGIQAPRPMRTGMHGPTH